MREIAVVPGADREDSQPIEADSNRDRLRRNSGPEGSKACEVEENERHGGRIQNILRRVMESCFHRAFTLGSGVRSTATRSPCSCLTSFSVVSVTVRTRTRPVTVSRLEGLRTDNRLATDQFRRQTSWSSQNVPVSTIPDSIF